MPYVCTTLLANDTDNRQQSRAKMPYADQPDAYWLLLSSEGYAFRCTMDDGEAAAQEILASGYPEAQEFAEKNVLKIPTSAEATEHFERMAEEH